MAEKGGQVWEVVGGGDQGGILVRTGEATSSKQEETRLATGALVRELELKGSRLHYDLISGTGPGSGWVSTQLKGKALLVKSDKEFPEEPPARSPKALMQLADVIADRGPPPETWWHQFWKDEVDASAAEVEAPAADAPKTGILPFVPRPNHKALPTLQDFNEAIQAKFRQRPTTPYARMFCFYGCGDSAGQWMQFIDDQPSWCEVVVYESKAHGVRPKEPWDRSYEERAEDAWENLRPAFEQHARGGCVEGAPFALYAHSAGIMLMILIAMRLRAEFGLEPTAVYVADQRAPHWPFINDIGQKLIADDGGLFLKIWIPNIGWEQNTRDRPQKGEMYETGGSKLICERWLIGHELLVDALRWCHKVSHMFHCPIFVFRGVFHKPPKGSEFERIAYEGNKEEEANKKAWGEWANWTSKDCTITEVDASHTEIWYHFDTEQPIWRSFGALADVHSRIPKKKTQKRDY